MTGDQVGRGVTGDRVGVGVGVPDGARVNVGELVGAMPSPARSRTMITSSSCESEDALGTEKGHPRKSVAVRLRRTLSIRMGSDDVHVL